MKNDAAHQFQLWGTNPDLFPLSEMDHIEWYKDTITSMVCGVMDGVFARMVERCDVPLILGVSDELGEPTVLATGLLTSLGHTQADEWCATKIPRGPEARMHFISTWLTENNRRYAFAEVWTRKEDGWHLQIVAVHNLEHARMQPPESETCESGSQSPNSLWL